MMNDSSISQFLGAGKVRSLSIESCWYIEVLGINYKYFFRERQIEVESTML